MFTGLEEMINMFEFSQQEFAIENENVGKLLMNILHHLYDRDVLDEAVILKWHKKLPETADVDHKRIHKQVSNS